MLWGGERYFRPVEEPPQVWEKVPVAGDGVLNQGRRHRGRESLGPTAVPATVIVKQAHSHPLAQDKASGKETAVGFLISNRALRSPDQAGDKEEI